MDSRDDCTEAGFLNALAANRADVVTRAVYADWLEERYRESEAYAQRWMIAWGKYPMQRPQGMRRIIKPFAWYPIRGDGELVRNSPIHLPHPVFLALPEYRFGKKEVLYLHAWEAEQGLIRAIQTLRYVSGLRK